MATGKGVPSCILRHASLRDAPQDEAQKGSLALTYVALFLLAASWALGTSNLRANVVSMAAGTIEARWTNLSVFWRAQIVGWGLFGVLDLVNRQLAYGDFGVALALTLIVTFCLALLSAAMR